MVIRMSPFGVVNTGNIEALRSVGQQQASPALTVLATNSLRIGEVPVGTKKAAINGMVDLGSFAPGLREVNRGQRTNAEYNTYAPTHLKAGSPYGNGAINVKAEPTADGALIKVDTFHGGANDEVTLMLCLEVLDHATGEQRNLVLSVPYAHHNFNPDDAAGNHRYEGHAEFTISYPEINAFLQERNPNLVIQPGLTPMSVAAVWSGLYPGKPYTKDEGKMVYLSEHRAGGPNRNGGFIAPIPLSGGGGEGGVQRNVLSLRAEGTRATATRASPLPLDVGVDAPPELIADFPEILEAGSKIESRNEDEDKAGIKDEATYLAAVKRAYELVQDPDSVRKLLGPDWTMKPIDRYWLNTDGELYLSKDGTPHGTLAKDAQGFAVQDPMHDIYLDSPDHALARVGGGARQRSNQTGTKFNWKPNGGVRDRSDAPDKVKRNELSWSMKAGTTLAQVKEFMEDLESEFLNGRVNPWTAGVFNHVNREMARTTGRSAAELLTPWLDVMQNRHKFELENHRTKVRAELSIDDVVATLLADPSKMVRFFVVETELDHMQMSSTNKMSFELPKDIASYENNAEQDEWLDNTSSRVTTVVEPRLHSIDDLSSSASAHSETENAFVDAIQKVKGYLFSSDALSRSEQKSVVAGKLLHQW